MANGQGVRQLASEVLKPSPNRRAQVALPARRPKSCPYFSHISLTDSPIIWRHRRSKDRVGPPGACILSDGCSRSRRD
jgi:hypothetical protein